MSTFLIGKDAALEESIQHFQQQLNALGIEIEEVSWLNPVPNVWSVHIRDKHCPNCFTNGKGRSQKAALASALGEYLERLATHYFFADYYLGPTLAEADYVHFSDEKWFTFTNHELPEGLLDKTLLSFYDENQELEADSLIDMQSSHFERGICALPFIRQSDHHAVYIPINIIENLYASNGMAAGNTPSEARVQALSEIFERYVKNKIIAEEITLPQIPTKVINAYPQIREAIQELEQHGFPIYCFDASLGGRYPVICVALLNPTNHTCFASFGAHPNFEVAFERTVTELLQGRSLKQLDSFSMPSFESTDIADQTNLETHFIDSSGIISWRMFNRCAHYPFVHWSFSGTTEHEFLALMTILEQENREVYIRDYCQLGAYVCRIIVPDFSEIYPADDLIYANNNMAIHWRDLILALPNSNEPDENYESLLHQLDDEGFDDNSRLRELLGIACSPYSLWYNVRIGDLKGMLALAAGNLEEAKIWIGWAIEFHQTNPQQEYYHYLLCLNTLLDCILSEGENELDNYRDSFNNMYSPELVHQAERAIHRQSHFYPLTAIDKGLMQLPSHQKLLAVYHKIHRKSMA